MSLCVMAVRVVFDHLGRETLITQGLAPMLTVFMLGLDALGPARDGGCHLPEPTRRNDPQEARD